jgi:hypothetical protein
MSNTYRVNFVVCDRTVTARFTHAAMQNIEETGADVADDLEAMIAGTHTRETLLAFCLEGADEDRVEGWRDYVLALEIAAEATS